MRGQIVILTGERGAGKSTVCRKIIALARENGYSCSGLLTENLPGNTLDLLDVRSGDVRRLTLKPGDESGLIQGRFGFDLQALAWGNSVLARSTPCDLLVVDELGPLEIERQTGLLHAFDVLSRNGFSLALVVIRSELLIKTQCRLPSSATTVLHATPDDRDTLPASILEMLDDGSGLQNHHTQGNAP